MFVFFSKTSVLTLTLLALVDAGGFAEAPQRPEATDPLPASAVARLGTLRFRQGSPITYAACVLDGKAILSVGREPPVRLFDARTGELLRTFNFAGREFVPPLPYPPHQEPVAVSPDHRGLLAGYGDKLQLIEISSGMNDISSGRFEEFAFTPHLLAFSPDGALVAAARAPESTDQDPKPQHRSGHIQVWDAKSGKSLRSFDAGQGAVDSLAVSRDSATLAVGSEGFDLSLWDLKSGKEIRRLPSEPASRSWFSDLSEHQHLDVLAFSPDGKFLVGGGREDMLGKWNWLDVWDASGKRLTRLLQNQDAGVSAVAFSPKGDMLVSAGRSSLNVWKMPAAEPLSRHFRAWKDRRAGLDSALSSAAFAADAKTICLGTEAGTLHFWDIDSARELHHLAGHTAPITRIAFSPDASTRIWNWRNSTQVRQFPCDALGLGTLTFSEHGKNPLPARDPDRHLSVSAGTRPVTPARAGAPVAGRFRGARWASNRFGGGWRGTGGFDRKTRMKWQSPPAADRKWPARDRRIESANLASAHRSNS